MPTRYKVLIADEYRMVAELCKILLEEEFDVVGIVNDGRDLIRLALDLNPDVILVDVSMPILNGLDAGGRLKEMLPNAKLVFLAIDSSPKTAAEAMLVGASGYVVKTCSASELMLAVRSVLQGKSYLCSAISKNRVDTLVWEGRSRERHGQELTSKQRDVLQLIAEGRRMKEVGVILGMSTRTVAFHKYNMRDALGLRNTAELIHYAMKNHMLGTQVGA